MTGEDKLVDGWWTLAVSPFKTTPPGSSEHGQRLGMRRLPCGPAWGHAGGFPGYRTWALNSKDGKRQVIVFANQEDSLPARAEEALEGVLATGYCGSRR